jgi:biopolymer transport protein ExbD
MQRKLFHRIVIIVFLAVLAIRLEQHFRTPNSTGIVTEIGNWLPPENCEFRIPLVIHIAANHALRLNAEPIAYDHLSPRLGMILKERLQPVLYVEADTAITFQEFAEILEAARESNDKIHIRLVTPGNRKYSCIDYQRGPAY